MADTFVAVLTPPGKAGVATIGVRGPAAWSMACELFQPARGKLPASPITNKFWYGRIGTSHADSAVLAAKHESPPYVEIHSHGGIEVVRFIQELFVQRGAVVVSWQHFLGDSFGILDMLANAPTLRTASILLDQHDGAWNRAVIEATPAAIDRLRALIPLGRHLVEPWQVVLAGAPNVGKSSLMNALAGYTRSVVTPIAGTTRDVVHCRLAIDGWPIVLIDTAGLREANESLEQLGIARAKAAASDADLRIWLVDGSEPAYLPTDADKWLFVINKIDLPPAWDWSTLTGALPISAHTGAGLAKLCAAISAALVPAPPIPGEAVPWHDEQRRYCEAQGDLISDAPARSVSRSAELT